MQIIRNHVTGISRNFGFITFKDEKPMRDAIEQMNGRKLDGSKVDPKDVKFECFVGHLADCTTEKDLEGGFSLFGEVIDSELRREIFVSIRLFARVTLLFDCSFIFSS